MIPPRVDHPRPFSQHQPLDAALKARLRAVLDGQRVTEAELRKLFEEGRACSLILSGDLEHTEQRLADLSLDATSSLADLAAAIRRANELHPELDELHALLALLEGRARKFRASWLLAPALTASGYQNGSRRSTVGTRNENA